MHVEAKVRWSLAKKLAGWGAIMALIVLALSVYSMYRLSLVQGYAEKSYSDAVIPLQQCAQLVMALAGVQSKINDHIASSETDKMDKLEKEMEAAFEAGDGFLQRLGSDEEIQVMRAKWGNVHELIRSAVENSKGFRKFEALSAVNGGEGLEQILALNKEISDLLARVVNSADTFQKESRVLGDTTTKHMFAASALAVILSVLIGLLLAQSIGRPLRELSGVAAKISEGDLTVQIPVQRRSDEIGTLAGSFQSMLTSLKKQSAKIREVVAQLNTVSTQLSTTMSELVQTASNTSSSVSQVTTTVEELKQAAELTSGRAHKVMQSSQEALSMSDSGNEATQMTLDKINLISDQMQTIGRTVVTLSEQTKAIEDIVASVQDLADQSNLLAVNASIEAARAGNHGKGFAVVAQEIKTLADESKEATDQIRKILDETRKWVSAVVMATEQGSKAVDSGVEQSALTREAIKALMKGVANSSQEASTIASMSEQQLAGIEQASTAMVVIDQAMRQNLDGTSQVAGAAKSLEDLGTQLNELVKYYRVESDPQGNNSAEPLSSEA